MGGLIKRIVLAVAFAIILLLSGNKARASGNTTLSVNYPSDIEAGKLFEITIDIEPALGVTVSGVQLDFVWDTKAFTVIKVNECNLFANEYFDSREIDNELGIIQYVTCVSLGEGSGTMLKGNVAVLDCMATVNPTPMNISLSNVMVGDYQAKELALEPYIINILKPKIFDPPKYNPLDGGGVLYSTPSVVSVTNQLARAVIPPALALGVVVMALRMGNLGIVGGFGSILLGVIVFVVANIVLAMV